VRRLLRNWQLKVLAVFIAATTWSVVAYAGNPPGTQVFRGVTVEHGQPPTGLILLKEPSPVAITVRGLQSNLGNFRHESLHAFIEMAGARRGANLLPVKVRVDSADRSVAFGSVDPTNVDVELDQLSQIQRRVDVRTHGTPNTCCALGAGTSSPDTVTLKGPATQLETAVAFVDVDVDGRGGAVQGQKVNVQLETPAKKPLPQVSSQPAQVTVSIEITAVKSTKPAGINPIPSGQVATGFVITDVQVSPAVVVVEADPGILASIHTIDTETISVSGASSDVVANVGLRPPSGVTVLTKGPFTVHFVIKINPDVQVTPSPRSSP
jgi:YbbR domain-containing protein